MRLGTYFSGGGGVDWGMREAGLTPTFAVELEADIAAVYERNFGHAPIVEDVRAIDPAMLPEVDWFHASPVCTRASIANQSGGEAALDIEMADAVCRAITRLQPPFFSLENVWQYRDFQAFKNICQTLEKQGYFFDYEHVNTADLGVPQTRKRLILRASRGLLPPLPAPVRWIGWYEAIADLIPTLPESTLAPWQLERLPKDIKESLLVSNAKTEWGNGMLPDVEPALSVTSQQLGRVKAVLVDAQNSARNATIRHESDPAPTVNNAAASRPSHSFALLFAGDSNADSWGDNFRQAEQPAFTAKENGVGRQRVMVADGFLIAGIINSSPQPVTIRGTSEPAFTITTSLNQRDIKAALPGYKVVAITPRALARFQSVPDAYWLPDKRQLAAKVIGNMVPPLAMQRIAEGMLA